MRAAGAPLAGAPAAAVLVHGRDQDAAFMLEVAERVGVRDVALLAPESETRSWYPGRFFDPLEANEPHVSQAVAAVEEAVEVATSAGVAVERVVLVGFSQGACVLTEVLRRRPRRFGAVAVLTGALIGDPAPLQGLDGLRMHVSCSRHDEWIPADRALAAAAYFERAGADVTTAITDERLHHVSDAEAATVRELLLGVPRS